VLDANHFPPCLIHVYAVYESGTLLLRDNKKHPLFPTLYQLAMTDYALFHSLLFAGALVLGARIPGEGPTRALLHKGEAIRQLNLKLHDPINGTDDATIGAILTLTGVDVSAPIVCKA
jgi:hypothetical protein